MAENTSKLSSGGKSIIIPTPPSAHAAIDFATVFGLVISFGLIIMAVNAPLKSISFIDGNYLLFVIIGTLAVTMISFSLSEFIQSLKVVLGSVFYQNCDVKTAAIFAVKLAEINRKSGILALENILPRIAKEYYLSHGIRLLADGTPVADAEKNLQEELTNMMSRHNKSAKILKRAADVSPAIGSIGSLIAVIQLLAMNTNLMIIGPMLAFALLPILYGLILSNMIFLPLASKLERHTEDEILINRLYILTVASIGKRDNPRKLENQINAALPHNKRLKYFD